MTLNSDFVRINLKIGTYDIKCIPAGFSWPPPERIIIDEKTSLLREAHKADDPRFVLRRTRMSELTAEQADHPNLARGAEYDYEEE